MSELLRYWLVADEYIGAALGVLVVLCLVREKLLAWPLGVVYVLVTIPQLVEARLYANLTLHVIGFLPLNLYGWYHWLFGGEQRDDLPVARASGRAMAMLVVACAIGSAGLGWLLAEHTDAAHPYWDNGVLLFSLAAMWLTARKLLENWILWFAVNIVSVPLYFAQDLPWYALLYALYLPMAVWGYASWRRTMREQEATFPAATRPSG